MKRPVSLVQRHGVLLFLSLPAVAGCFCLLLFASSAGAVPAVPNSGILTGKVMEFSITSSVLSGIKPEQVLYRFVISADEIEDVEGSPNFLQGREGKFVTLYSKEKLSPELFGKKVKAEVEFRGDERGGLFWIRRIEAAE